MRGQQQQQQQHHHHHQPPKSSRHPLGTLPPPVAHHAFPAQELLRRQRAQVPNATGTYFSFSAEKGGINYWAATEDGPGVAYFDENFLAQREKQLTRVGVASKKGLRAFVAKLSGPTTANKRQMAHWVIDQERPSLPGCSAQGMIGEQSWMGEGAAFSRGSLVNRVLTLMASSLERGSTIRTSPSCL